MADVWFGEVSLWHTGYTSSYAFLDHCSHMYLFPYFLFHVFFFTVFWIHCLPKALSYFLALFIYFLKNQFLWHTSCVNLQQHATNYTMPVAWWIPSSYCLQINLIAHSQLSRIAVPFKITSDSLQSNSNLCAIYFNA